MGFDPFSWTTWARPGFTDVGFWVVMLRVDGAGAARVTPASGSHGTSPTPSLLKAACSRLRLGGSVDNSGRRQGGSVEGQSRASRGPVAHLKGQLRASRSDAQWTPRDTGESATRRLRHGLKRSTMRFLALTAAGVGFEPTNEHSPVAGFQDRCASKVICDRQSSGGSGSHAADSRWRSCRRLSQKPGRVPPMCPHSNRPAS